MYNSFEKERQCSNCLVLYSSQMLFRVSRVIYNGEGEILPLLVSNNRTSFVVTTQSIVPLGWYSNNITSLCFNKGVKGSWEDSESTTGPQYVFSSFPECTEKKSQLIINYSVELFNSIIDMQIIKKVNPQITKHFNNFEAHNHNPMFLNQISIQIFSAKEPVSWSFVVKGSNSFIFSSL
jgi:hypothetical protein